MQIVTKDQIGGGIRSKGEMKEDQVKLWFWKSKEVLRMTTRLLKK